jgi:hypothetical protein
MRVLIEITGYIGMVATLGAYFGLERGKFQSSGLIYPILNAITGVCFLIMGAFYKTYPLILLNLFWLIISISLLKKNLRLIKKNNKLGE